MIGKLLFKLALMFSFTFVYGEEFYVYSNIDSSRLSIALSKSRTELIMGHLEVEAKACDYGKVDLCIESDRLIFALPEQGRVKINSEWTSERTEQDEHDIFGKKIKLTKIVFSKKREIYLHTGTRKKKAFYL